ncbi:jg12529 [Pararge aegeria aegeria]|uniref:Jg12529 protein n=1 Tax=Pararge aegeria aegeria TaxID=348720 RepID=A0A8S4QPP8_9NEOP|nr:jg12529 [Pararge aegeria aegeria]
MGAAYSSENRWTLGLQECTPRTSKRGIGRPPKRFRDDIRRVAGSPWKQAAQQRGFWNSLQTTYVQQQSLIGLSDVDDGRRLCGTPPSKGLTQTGNHHGMSESPHCEICADPSNTVVNHCLQYCEKCNSPMFLA